MKVLQILYGGLGGHGSVFFSMVEADRQRMLQHEAIFIGIESLKPEYADRCNRDQIPYRLISKKPGKHIRFFFQLLSAARHTSADVVVVHGYSVLFPIWIAQQFRRKKFRLVTVMHQPIQLMSKTDWFSLKFSLKRADMTVFLTEEYKRACERFFSRKLDHKTAVIPNGIDLDQYKPAPRAAADNEQRIGMQSRITGYKDHATLLRAFKLLKEKLPLKNIKLYLAGDGDLKQGMESLAAELGLSDKVVFTGMLPEEELPAFINSLDIYIHSTHGEAMSTAIMQVMACKLPIIASDVTGVNNMILHEQTGLLVEPKNPESLCDAMMRYIDDVDTAANMGARAYAHAVRNFGNDLMFSKYLGVFEHA